MVTASLNDMKQPNQLLLAIIVLGSSTGCDSFNIVDSHRDVILMETTAGTIEIELYARSAPRTVRNFLRYVDAGAYDGGEIWRIVNPSNDNNPSAISIVQGSAREGFPPYPPVEHETTQLTKLTHNDGALSLARAEPGTADSEFFISIGDNFSLDHGGKRNSDGQGFAVFGRVVSGMEVVRGINSRETTDDPSAGYFRGQQLTTPIVINHVRRLE